MRVAPLGHINDVCLLSGPGIKNEYLPITIRGSPNFFAIRRIFPSGTETSFLSFLMRGLVPVVYSPK